MSVTLGGWPNPEPDVEFTLYTPRDCNTVRCSCLRQPAGLNGNTLPKIRKTHDEATCPGMHHVATLLVATAGGVAWTLPNQPPLAPPPPAPSAQRAPPTLATFGISSPSPPLPALRSVLAKLAPLAASCTLALASSSGGGRASALLPLIVATLPGTEAGKRTKSHRQRSSEEAQIAINSRHGGRRKGGMTGDWCFRPAETYCIGGSHTPKAERVGRHICSVLGTHCHLTDGVWADNASAPSFFNRMRVPSQWRHTYSLKKLGILAAHYDAWGAMSAQGTSTSKEWVVVLEGADAMLNPLLSLGSAENMTRVVPLGLREALCSQAAVKRGLVYLGRCSNALKLPNATALYPDSCVEHQSLAAFEGKLTVASCTNTLCTHAYAIQRRVASDLYSNLFATYNVCSFHRCNTDRALDLYTKVVKKHPAAVVLHASNKRHVFKSYDGLFIQRKGGFMRAEHL